MNRWYCLLFCALAGAGLAAQTPEPPGKGKPLEPRDPTKPSPELKEAMGNKPIAPGPGAPEKQPVLVLKGRVLAKNKPAAALLDIDGKIYLVGKDTDFLAGGRTLRVKDITIESVVIELPGSKTTITLR
jgi:hypothetical protein